MGIRSGFTTCFGYRPKRAHPFRAVVEFMAGWAAGFRLPASPERNLLFEINDFDETRQGRGNGM